MEDAAAALGLERGSPPDILPRYLLCTGTDLRANPHYLAAENWSDLADRWAHLEAGGAPRAKARLRIVTG